MESIAFVISFIEAVGWLQTLSWLLGMAALIWIVSTGVIPVIWNLGLGLAKRKVAIFAKGDHLQGMEDLLLDSGLFKKKNIKRVSSREDVGIAEKATVFLLHWNDWKDEIDTVLALKRDGTVLVVYAPDGPSSIPKKQFRQITEARNTSVTNFRGRLLNDLVTSMITRSYQKERL